jgi:hypothetical protein
MLLNKIHLLVSNQLKWLILIKDGFSIIFPLYYDESVLQRAQEWIWMGDEPPFYKIIMVRQSLV